MGESLEDLSFADPCTRRSTRRFVPAGPADRAPSRGPPIWPRCGAEDQRHAQRSRRVTASSRAGPSIIWSIYQKMIVKGRDFFFSTNNSRTSSGCVFLRRDSRDLFYAAVGVVHFAVAADCGPVSRTYIAQPRYGVYPVAAHHLSSAPEGKPLEVQIRTNDICTKDR